MRRLRDKLTYSNVMVTVLAVIVLGGGTAYAASVVTAKPNSIGPVQLKDEAVGSAELQDGAVGLQQLEDESVNASKIKDGSVTLSKLSTSVKGELKAQKGEKGATGETGAAGAQGQAGPPGPAATSTTLSIEHVSGSSAQTPATEKEVSVVCPSGKVLGGGYVLNSFNNPAVTLRAVRSYAVSEGTWLVRALNGGAAENWELTVVAVCAS